MIKKKKKKNHIPIVWIGIWFFKKLDAKQLVHKNNIK